MLTNYFKIALQKLLLNKAFCTVNILGSALGISSLLVIFLMVPYDFSFDKFEKGGGRIYRVVQGHWQGASVSPIIALLSKDFLK